MPGMDGIEATQLITAGDTRARVLVLTTFDDDDYVYGALRAGASGFLVKDMAQEDILTAIRVVAAGDAIIAPGVTRRLIAQFAASPAPAAGPGRSPGSPTANARYSGWWAWACPTPRSPPPCTSPQAPPRRTWPGCWPKLDARDRVQLVITAGRFTRPGGMNHPTSLHTKG